LVYAGDCDFTRKDFAQAATLFRKAVQIDPLDEKGWRYLADALLSLGKLAEAREALVAGISAFPRYLPTWSSLADLPGPGPAWKSLGLKPKAKAVKDLKTGKFTVVLDQDLLKGRDKDAADTAVWLAFAMTQVVKETKEKAGEPISSPFKAMLEAWTTTLKVAEDLVKGGHRLTDPVLLQMQAFRKAGDLEPCLLLLAFKGSYRDDFEAWKKAHPTGVRTFLETYRIKP
jgi:tetratricopeptide (TPR) repeat protein